MHNADNDSLLNTPRRFLHGLMAEMPIATALLSINIVAFIVITALGTNVLGGRIEDYLRFGANFAPLTTDRAWWRLASSTLVHIGVLHLACNMWALWDCGRISERVFGGDLLLALYLYSAACAGCATLWWNTQAISTGASGAIFGLYGALLAHMTLRRCAIPVDIMNRMRISSGVFVAYSLFTGFAHAGVDNAAHLGGLAGGYAMGLVMSLPQRHANGLPRAVWAALLAALTLPAAALLAPESARIYRQAVTLEKESAAYSSEEARLSAEFQSIVEQTRNRKLNDADALRLLRTRILPAWNQAVERLANIEIDAKAPLRKDYDLLLRYATARRDLTKAIADYLETSEPAHEKLIARLRNDVERTRLEYQQRQKQ